MTFLSILILLGLTLFAISLQRSYTSMPLKELRRRSRAGDSVATALVKAAAYGQSLQTLLRSITIIVTALLFILLARQTETWFAFVMIGAVLWFGFIWLPARAVTDRSLWLAQQAAPGLAKILQYLHPMLDKLRLFAKNNHPISIHTGMYDRDDLRDLFARQRVQADNRVDDQTLAIVEQVLHFGDMKVSDILTPRRVVKAVAATETVGPLLMDDLHKSGHSRFPVYDSKQDDIIGILYLRTLVKAKTGGSVLKSMSKQVCYVHEDQPLTEALQAILKTHQQLFIVINSFEEYVGIVSIEDIMESILGKQIVDEFDEYEDLRAVAAKMAQKEHKERIATEPTHENIQSVTEVIE